MTSDISLRPDKLWLSQLYLTYLSYWLAYLGLVWYPTFSDMISAKPTCRNMLVMYIYFTVNELVASFSISESDPELGVKDFHGSTMERGYQ